MDIQCVVDSRCHTGECPVWDDDRQVLWWIDIPNQTLHRYDPSSTEHKTHPLPAVGGAFALTATGDLLLGLKTGLHRFDPTTGEAVMVQPSGFTHPDERYNDGRCDRRGRFWLSTMRDPQDAVAKAGEWFRIDPDLAKRAFISGLITANGLAFSPDDRTLYMADTHRDVQTAWAWDFDLDDGTITNRRVFVDFRELNGRPDGAAMDADGCYWVAANSGWRLIRFTPDGRVEREVELPVRRPTMLAFAGRELDTIFVTSQHPQGDETWEGQPNAGGLFALHLGIKGLPEPRFRG